MSERPRAEGERRGHAEGEARVDHGEAEGTHELHEGEGRRHRQVEEVDRLPVNFHFEGRKLRAAEDEDDAEAGEVEDEHEQRGGEDRRVEEGQRHFEKRARAVRAEDARRAVQPGIEVRPEVADQSEDDGGVIENVREEDRAEGVRQIQRRGVGMPHGHQP